MWPGMQFQRLTTREPDLAMCAVAIAALERVRDDETVVKLDARRAPATDAGVHPVMPARGTPGSA